jgi:hypothetical protein
MDAEIIIKANISNVCDKEDLKNISFNDMVNYQIKENGLMSIMDDKFEIIDIREGRISFFDRMLSLGLKKKQTCELLDALNKLHNALCSLDESSLEKLQNLGGLDNLYDFYLSCDNTCKRIKLK